MKTITLLDGEHVLSPPTFYALTLMDEYDVDFSDDFKPSNVAGMLAAFLTDSEPFSDGKPAKVWTPAEAAKVLTPKAAPSIIDTLAELMAEAFPDVEGSDRPT